MPYGLHPNVHKPVEEAQQAPGVYLVKFKSGGTAILPIVVLPDGRMMLLQMTGAELTIAEAKTAGCWFEGPFT